MPPWPKFVRSSFTSVLEDCVEENLEGIGVGRVKSPFKDLMVWGRTLLAWLLEMGKATAQSNVCTAHQPVSPHLLDAATRRE